MAIAVPAFATVHNAINAAIAALFGSTIPAGSEVFNLTHRFEDEGEELYLRQVAQAKAGGELDVFYIDMESQDALEGPAVGERYAIYNVVIRHWNVRTNDLSWIDSARDIGEVVAATLENNASVFAILGQRQLRTPQTVTYDGYNGLTALESAVVGGPQLVVQGFIRLAVEARRWT